VGEPGDMQQRPNCRRQVRPRLLSAAQPGRHAGPANGETSAQREGRRDDPFWPQRDEVVGAVMVVSVEQARSDDLNEKYYVDYPAEDRAQQQGRQPNSREPTPA